ncbi:MAG TPA: hypothetical protein VJN02_12915 [Gammaproteobacteria bacterium]|nr:hypothetical protein [Gammaproteobacteria bacterium]
MINFKKSINTDVISLAEIGWTESRDDIQIKKYIKSFIQNNYEKKIDDDLALIILLIIDDLLVNMQSTEVQKPLAVKKRKETKK